MNRPLQLLLKAQVPAPIEARNHESVHHTAHPSLYPTRRRSLSEKVRVGDVTATPQQHRHEHHQARIYESQNSNEIEARTLQISHLIFVHIAMNKSLVDT